MRDGSPITPPPPRPDCEVEPPPPGLIPRGSSEGHGVDGLDDDEVDDCRLPYEGAGEGWRVFLIHIVDARRRRRRSRRKLLRQIHRWRRDERRCSGRRARARIAHQVARLHHLEESDVSVKDRNALVGRSHTLDVQSILSPEPLSGRLQFLHLQTHSFLLPRDRRFWLAWPGVEGSRRQRSGAGGRRRRRHRRRHTRPLAHLTKLIQRMHRDQRCRGCNVGDMRDGRIDD